MDRDAINLFDLDRQRFLTLFREFLENNNIPDEIKRSEISATAVVLGQMCQLVGPDRGMF
jgi:hypothetical protein